MKVLLSIKPEFANKIFSGQKKFEYRRSIFKRSNIDTVIVYASAPIRKVIGEFKIEQILFEDIDILWEETKLQSGINEEYFYSYFTEREKGYAIQIKSTRKYPTPKNLNNAYGITPPQSFVYVN